MNQKAAFLFAYRAIAYERFAKEAQKRGIDIQRELDCGQPFWKQAAIQMHLHTLLGGIAIGMRDVESWKALYDERLLSGRLDQFRYVGAYFDRVLPFVAATAFHPEFDLEGRRLQRLGRGSAAFEHIPATATAYGNQTILVLGWIGASNGPAAKLADSFLAVQDARKADALLQLLFVQSDNIFLRPSWWAEWLPDLRLERDSAAPPLPTDVPAG